MRPGNREEPIETVLNRALAINANVPTPPGLERRVLAEFEKRKVRSRRRLQTTCALFAAGLCGIVILYPRNNVQSMVTTASAVRQPDVVNSVVLKEPPKPVKPASARTVTPGKVFERPMKSAISELEIEPLQISSLK